MTDNVEYGPEIAVDGMPDWLGEDEEVIGRWGEDNWYSGGPTWKKCYASPGDITAIRLPADHWAYKAEKGSPSPQTLGEILKDTVTISKMTEEEWNTLIESHDWSIISALRQLGIIKSPPTLLEQFEEHHGSLDHNQRAILEIYQEWVEGQ